MDGYFDRLANAGDAVALIDADGVTTSYRELAAAADAVAARLGSESRLVLIEARTGVPTVVAYLAALRARHPVLLTNGPAPEALRRRYDPAVIIDGDGGIRETGAAPILLHPDLALLMSTSGSTGGAKLVRLSRAAIEANALAIAHVLGIAPGDRAITTLPLGFSYGLSVLQSHLAVGAAVILTERSVIEDAFWSFAETHGATSLAGVPFTYELLEKTGFRDRDYPALTSLTTSGGRLPLELAQTYATWAAERGKRFFLMYGQTEAASRIACLPPELAEAWPESVGTPLPGTTLRIDAATGELVFTGPNVMMGYATGPEDLARGPELTELRTGDIGELVAPGVFRITGRLSRFSKIAGLRVGHDDLEQRLAAARIAAVVTGDDTGIVVAVTLPASAAEALAAVRAVSQLPERSITAVAFDTLPRGAAGKPDLVAILAAGHAARVALPAPAADFANIYQRLLGRAVGADDSFTTLGADSLSYVEVTMAIEARLGTLPMAWEQLTTAQLDALAADRGAAPQAPTRVVPAETLVRCAAILGVLVNHSIGGGSNVAGGALTLMMVAGFSLNRYQRNQLLAARWQVIERFVRVLLVPYFVVVVVTTALSNQIGFAWPQLLPIGNLIHAGRGPLVAMWFIEALSQLTLAAVLLFGIPAVRHAAVGDRWRFAVLLLGVAILLRLTLQIAMPEHPQYAGAPWRPDGWAIVIALGWAVAEAKTVPQRLLCLIPAYLFPALTWGWTEFYALWLPSGTALILFAPRVRVWRPAANLLGLVTPATYFIYLTHMITMSVIWRILGRNHAPVLSVIASIVTGVAAWYAWSAALRMLPRLRAAGFRVRPAPRPAASLPYP